MGGGLAGLAVLDALARAGRAARLLEASPRLGGRILTLRRGLAPGLRAEAGAERILRGHRRVRALAARLGVHLVDYPETDGAFVFRHAGRMVRFRQPSELPPELTQGLSPEEREEWPFRLHLLYARMAAPVADDDPRTGLQWLRDLGLTERGAAFVRNFATVDPGVVSAAAFQRMSQRELDDGRPQVVQDGTDHLVRALAARHDHLIRKDTKIVRVSLEADRVVLVDAKGSAHFADHVVLALPLRPLSTLEFHPGTPRMVLAWRAARRPAFEVKVHAQIRAAELHALGLSPFAMGLDFPRMTWALPEASPDGEVVLNAMASGAAIPLVQSHRARGAKALEELLRARLPWLRSLHVTTIGESLFSDPLLGGAYAYTPVGAPFAPPPVREHRLTLAGSDLSQQAGWMEGALESAERAVGEILAVPGEVEGR
ncbi:MAG TPA: FAD-dependent oxidoreductase [Anaeromyxobacteraceae bacterium]|nr:FAD-dependent oxidoreductase [Anaeromyxobacteraceae bacterium]